MKWEGGPHLQYGIKFSVSNSSIAVVTETGLVRGVAVGVVKIRGTLQTQNTEALLTVLQVAHIVYLKETEIIVVFFKSLINFLTCRAI